ncbi:hypothetical protein K458DRAFT_429780 [Lentithecium fluviatile CBS 122367]|uniref:Uncharacterized protein n=1 Tax=Lentithecium fluviatile CBS 122367 TaxID=1168545 RepID=A0A6G1J9H2_9PLEO|nr:hypothetical protein K458DRAFT_429780 [Lentithecium fluviatile CBS 122367]
MEHERITVNGQSSLHFQHLSEPSQHYHPKRMATICRHQLHFSASPHTPYCPACIHAAAISKTAQALDGLNRNGSSHRSWNAVDLRLNRAKLSYKIAIQRLEQVREKGQLRAEREQAWDEAHSKAQVACVGEVGNPNISPGCPVCFSMRTEPEGHQAIDQHTAWWERPGALAPNAAPRTPLRSRGRKRPYALVHHGGSPTMRGIIREHRAAHAAEMAEQEQLERRYKTETAVRRKHRLSDDTQFEADFWDSPISGLITRQNHVSTKEYQRMSERRARGNTPRPRPPRSSLSYCESAGQLEVGEHVEQEIRAAEEAQEREKLEKRARKVGAEVGYLYFSGTVDGLDDWREKYLRSNHGLIWRDRLQRGDAMEDEMEDAMYIDDAPPSSPI